MGPAVCMCLCAYVNIMAGPLTHDKFDPSFVRPAKQGLLYVFACVFCLDYKLGQKKRSMCRRGVHLSVHLCLSVETSPDEDGRTSGRERTRFIGKHRTAGGRVPLTLATAADTVAARRSCRLQAARPSVSR